MIRSTKIAALLLFFAALGSTAVYAQNTQLPQQQQEIKVDEAELTKFAYAFQQIRVLMAEAQQEMSEVIKEEGMEIQRFNEIHQAQMNPEAEVEATAKEKEDYQDIIAELEKMQQGIQEKMEKAVTEKGLTPERYEQIATALQNSPELQERLKQVFQK